MIDSDWRGAQWSCPDCPWVHRAHPAYGWQKHDERAVEVHQRALCPARGNDVDMHSQDA